MEKLSLASLKALTKRHYTWGLQSDVITNPDWRCELRNSFRLLGSFAVFGELVTRAELIILRDIMDESVDLRPNGGFVVHYSGYKRFWEHVDRTAWKKDTAPTFWGASWKKEKELYLQSLLMIHSILGDRVTLLAFDDESMIVKNYGLSDEAKWNDPLREKLHFMRDVGSAVFPGADTLRYNEGWSNAFNVRGLRDRGTNTPLYEVNDLNKSLGQIRGAREHPSRVGQRTWFIMLNATNPPGGVYTPDAGIDLVNTETVAREIGRNNNEPVIFKNSILPANNSGVIAHLKAYIRGAEST